MSEVLSGIVTVQTARFRWELKGNPNLYGGKYKLHVFVERQGKDGSVWAEVDYETKDTRWLCARQAKRVGRKILERRRLAALGVLKEGEFQL